MNYDPNIHHRRSIRLEGYDYSQEGLHFLTLCTENKKCLFGHIVDGEMILNEPGTIAYHEWLQTPVIRKYIGLDAFVIMPNHIHGIIVIRRGELNSPTQHSFQNNNEIASHWGECNSPLRPVSPSQTIGAVVRGYKSSVTRKINALQNFRNIVVWQRNYWEHIIRDLQSYTALSDYIINNPKNWMTDTLFPPPGRGELNSPMYIGVYPDKLQHRQCRGELNSPHYIGDNFKKRLMHFVFIETHKGECNSPLHTQNKKTTK